MLLTVPVAYGDRPYSHAVPPSICGSPCLLCSDVFILRTRLLLYMYVVRTFIMFNVF